MRTAAVIGCGKKREGKEGFAIGHQHGKGYANGAADAKLYAVDPDPENLRGFAEQFDVPEAQCFKSTEALYAELVPDVVSVCTWPELHRPQVIEAAQAGAKGIVCEKPMALDAAECEEMERVCRKQGTRLAVAHQRAYDGAFVRLKELLQQGVLGEGLCAEFRVGDDWDLLSWGVHWLDLANWLFDAVPETVLAGIDHNGTRRYRHAVEDGSVVLSEYPNGNQALVLAGPGLPDGRMVHVRGPDGMIAVEKDQVAVFGRDGFTAHAPAPVEHGGFAGLMAEMFSAIEEGAPLRLDVSRTGYATRMAWAAQESARTQRRVPVPPDVQFAPLEVLQQSPEPDVSLGRVVLHGDDHHRDPETGEGGREGLAEAVRALGAEALTVIPAEARALTPQDLEGADLLLLYHTRRAAPEETRQAITDWVEAGKPLGVMHCGIGAYSEWETFRDWLGRHWVWGDEPGLERSGHPHEPCPMEVLAPATFRPGWKRAWLPRDEVYVKLHERRAVEELATGHIERGAQPIAWRSLARPNVGVWAPGHRKDMWRVPAMRDGFLATVRCLQEGGTRVRSE
jgi:predicted dehydrogenase